MGQDSPETPPVGDADAELFSRIEDAVIDSLQVCDPERRLSRRDCSDIGIEVIEKVAGVMQDEERVELGERDLEYIQARVRDLTRAILAPCIKRRFALQDRVVCNIGGERGWAAGVVQALDEDDKSDPTGQTSIPYVVKIDPPSSRLVSVPRDANAVVLPEVCFGQRDGAIWLTRMCLPKAVRKGSQKTRRFSQGERVACAVEDATGDYSDWAAGTVLVVDHPVEGSEGVAGGLAPYQVRLDSGCDVIVHQDEHWLIRDLALQPVGRRIAADGTRDMKRMGKRKGSGDSWEAMDHTTRKVRKLHSVEESDDED